MFKEWCLLLSCALLLLPLVINAKVDNDGAKIRLIRVERDDQTEPGNPLADSTMTETTNATAEEGGTGDGLDNTTSTIPTESKKHAETTRDGPKKTSPKVLDITQPIRKDEAPQTKTNYTVAYAFFIVIICIGIVVLSAVLVYMLVGLRRDRRLADTQRKSEEPGMPQGELAEGQQMPPDAGPQASAQVVAVAVAPMTQESAPKSAKDAPLHSARETSKSAAPKSVKVAEKPKSVREAPKSAREQPKVVPTTPAPSAAKKSVREQPKSAKAPAPTPKKAAPTASAASASKPSTSATKTTATKTTATSTTSLSTKSARK